MRRNLPIGPLALGVQLQSGPDASDFQGWNMAHSLSQSPYGWEEAVILTAQKHLFLICHCQALMPFGTMFEGQFLLLQPKTAKGSKS